ncbi:hypothetical protein GCM10027161_29160 [Microbispora hainanensis]
MFDAGRSVVGLRLLGGRLCAKRRVGRLGEARRRRVGGIPGEPKPIRIVGSRYGVREWATDRGLAKLPTWTFFTDSGGTAEWPALAPDAFWKLGELRSSVSVQVTSAGPEQTSLSATVRQ